MAVVALKYVVEAFLQQHRERFTQSVQQIGCGRVREISGFVGPEHVVPAPVRFGQRGFFRRGERLVADRVERQSGRQHQTFLRTRDGDIDAPFIVAVINRCE